MAMDQVNLNVAASIFIQMSFYFLLRLNKSIRDNPKRLSWVLTLSCATVTTPCSFQYVLRYVYSWNQAANFQSDALSQFLVTYFTIFLILDMTCARLHYNAQMEYLEGWVHHVAYVGFFIYCLHQEYTIGVMTTLPLELPTFFLALGKVFPAMRSDWLFGAIFFLTRIVYHSYLLYMWFNMVSPPVRLWPITAITLLFHLYWFTLWSRGQIRRLRNKTKQV